MSSSDDFASITTRVARLLQERRERVVFAESCTAGWVAALLSAEPGISAHLCGSLVTYRESCKQAWLGVDEWVLREHTAVSAPVTRQMALGALARTDEAHWAVAVTGHVGPQAPPELDGVCFVALARRAEVPTPAASPAQIVASRVQLTTAGRVERQQEAARWVLERLGEALAAAPLA
jgi:nicotinamide-nucleotide amidase